MAHDDVVIAGIRFFPDNIINLFLTKYSAWIVGYSLGLSIAKELVEMHKGKIELSDTLGGGCTFKISLPL